MTETSQSKRNELAETIFRKLEQKRMENAVILKRTELHPPRYSLKGVEWLNSLEVAKCSQIRRRH